MKENCGTKSLLRHIKRCSGITSSSPSQSLLKFNTDNSTTLWKFSQEASRKKLAEMIIGHGMPFSLVENSHFKSFIQSLQPLFTIPSRSTIKKECIELYWDLKDCLKNELIRQGGKVSLTSDIWTSNQNIGYLSVTCHWIDTQWHLQQRVINFKNIPAPHTGKALYEMWKESLNDWNLTDKASPQEIAKNYLKANHNAGILNDPR